MNRANFEDVSDEMDVRSAINSNQMHVAIQEFKTLISSMEDNDVFEFMCFIYRMTDDGNKKQYAMKTSKNQYYIDMLRKPHDDSTFSYYEKDNKKILELLRLYDEIKSCGHYAPGQDERFANTKTYDYKKDDEEVYESKFGKNTTLHPSSRQPVYFLKYAKTMDANDYDAKYVQALKIPKNFEDKNKPLYFGLEYIPVPTLDMATAFKCQVGKDQNWQIRQLINAMIHGDNDKTYIFLMRRNYYVATTTGHTVSRDSVVAIWNPNTFMWRLSPSREEATLDCIGIQTTDVKNAWQNIQKMSKQSDSQKNDSTSSVSSKKSGDEIPDLDDIYGEVLEDELDEFESKRQEEDAKKKKEQRLLDLYDYLTSGDYVEADDEYEGANYPTNMDQLASIINKYSAKAGKKQKGRHIAGDVVLKFKDDPTDANFDVSDWRIDKDTIIFMVEDNTDMHLNDVMSPSEYLRIAEQHPGKKFIFRDERTNKTYLPSTLKARLESEFAGKDDNPAVFLDLSFYADEK